MQYFQITLHFSSVDQAHMFVLAGLCGTFTQLVILRVLLKFVGKHRMLLIGESSAHHSMSPTGNSYFKVEHVFQRACAAVHPFVRMIPDKRDFV